MICLVQAPLPSLTTPLPLHSERRLVLVDGVVGLQRAVWAWHPEAVPNLHQPGAAQRRGVLRGHVGAEDQLRRVVSRLVVIATVVSDPLCLCMCACVRARVCRLTSCLVAVDGGWDEWSEWTVCSSQCERQRRRECNSPAPRYRGRACDGNGEDTDNCTGGLCTQSKTALPVGPLPRRRSAVITS